MFKFLKEKLGKVVSAFSESLSKPEEKEKIPEAEKIIEKKKEEKIERIEKKIEAKERKEEKPIEKKKEEEIEKKKEKASEQMQKHLQVPEIKEAKKGFAERIAEKITKTTISEDKFESLFSELEIVLLENNVAVEVIDKIKDDLKKNLVDVPLSRNSISNIIKESLKSSLYDLFSAPEIDIVAEAKKKKPLVVLFVGINGSGKTTTIAKIARLLQKNSLKCAIAAADTFRAAAIQQLEKHGEALGVKVIKHDYGSDAAAVAFDAIKYAEAKKLDAVLIDTAGRLHSNVNLMDELKKVARVAKPDLKIFVGESITGNDCVEQAKEFDSAIGIDGIILAKADIDEKGGAAISVSYVTSKPILYLGTGQGYDDLKSFDSKSIVASVGL